MKCEKCKIKLETVGGRYYIHPASDTCKEEDGITIVVDYKIYNKWKEIYGVPKPKWYTKVKEKVQSLSLRFTKNSEK